MRKWSHISIRYRARIKVQLQQSRYGRYKFLMGGIFVDLCDLGCRQENAQLQMLDHPSLCGTPARWKSAA